MEATVLGIIWYFLIFLLIAGYFVLDGFDLGVGVLYPFLARTEEDRGLMRRSIGPVWDGNEVWLLTAGGALFAAFAPAYATTFSGFYLAIMLVLFGLILRAVSLEFAHRDPKWIKLWNGCFYVGSLLPALLMGVAVGNIYAGIPMDANGDYSGVPLLGLVTPFTLLTGLLGLAMFCAAGAAWLAAKAPEDSDLYLRAIGARRLFQLASIALFLVVSAYAHLGIHPAMAPEFTVLRGILAVLFLVAVGASLMMKPLGHGDTPAFLLQSVAAAVLVFLLATSMFPNLVVASADSIGPSITIANAASGDYTLAWMTGIACVGVPLVLVYHFIVYRMFRGRLS